MCFVVYLTARSQITTGELPASFKRDIPVLKETGKSVKILPAVDMDKLKKEDEENDAQGLPPRFGFRHRVEYNLDNSGEWVAMPNGDRIWRLVIHCPGSLSINLLYDKFWIPDSAKFFIYSANKKHHIGAVASVNNKGGKYEPKGFATGLVYGDKCTLEYYVPHYVKEVGIISVAYVVHGYRYILVLEEDGFGTSGDCQVNVNCSEGYNWRAEKQAVALIVVNGAYWCTGSLVRNTSNDYKPYFLTANHCLDTGKDAITDPNLNYWTFYWQYESP
jgi:hypothetical protein